MKFKVVNIVLTLLISLSSFAQRSLEEFKISDCHGAVLINRAGDYKMRFTGSSGNNEDLSEYKSLKDKVTESNSIWSSFESPFDGTLYMDLSAESFLKMVIFKSESSNFCGEVHRGVAEIERLIAVDSANNIGLSEERKKGYLYPIEMRKNQEIFFMINSDSDDRNNLKMNISFRPTNVKEITDEMRKIVDRTKDGDYPVLKVSLRDANTGLPVEGQVVVKESRDDDALYFGTDFLFSAYRRGSYNFSIDAPGYFFYDREETVDGEEDKELVIWLQPANIGSKVRLKEIQFQMGTTDFYPGAEAQLKRLRDFLHLNSDIKIEIQGHVHSDGSSSFAAKRMSVARAKKVRNFLTDHGIDKKRLEVEGYGDEEMIYPEAKLASEEQANRRVEIEIIEIENE